MTALLIVSIITGTGFAICYKIAANRRCNLLLVNVWMYVSALISMVLYVALTKHITFDWKPALLGSIAGMFGYIATVTFFLHMRRGQLTSSWTVINLSVGFPVIASMVIWREHPTPRQITGLLLMFTALLLFGRREWKNRGLPD